MDENTFNPEVPGQEPTVNVETTPVVEPTPVEPMPVEQQMPTDIPQEMGVSQAAAPVTLEPTMEANTSDQATKILKVAVPIIVALVVVVGGYFAYATFFGGSDVPAVDQSETADNIPNFLENAASQEQIPSDYEDALQDLTTEQPTQYTGTPVTETPAVETPATPETPKVKVPRT